MFKDFWAKKEEQGEPSSKERQEFEKAMKPPPITSDVEARVAGWCSEHGLLGLLTQNMDALFSPPIRKGKQRITYYIERLTHPGKQWQRVAHSFRPDERPLDSAHMIVRPFGVVGGNLDGVDHWMQFMPGASRKADPYPEPFSEDFWRLYAEPIDEFLDAAARLSDAVARLTGAAATVKTVVDNLERVSEEWCTTRESERGEILYGLQYLQGLVSAATFGLAPRENGGFRRVWAAPSLLATYGLMILEDLAEERRAHRCEACQHVFFSRAQNRRYCSRTCRKRVKMRRYRESLRISAIVNAQIASS